MCSARAMTRASGSLICSIESAVIAGAAFAPAVRDGRVEVAGGVARGELVGVGFDASSGCLLAWRRANRRLRPWLPQPAQTAVAAVGGFQPSLSVGGSVSASAARFASASAFSAELVVRLRLLGVRFAASLPLAGLFRAASRYFASSSRRAASAAVRRSALHLRRAAARGLRS